MELAATFAVALAFALIHFAGARFDFLRTVPRSIWLSAAGGVSVAYVFVHILPDLAEHQRGIDRAAEAGLLAALEHHVWLVAMIGLCAFYGLDRFARRKRTDSSAYFAIHLGSFALYNLLIGYLLVQREGGLLFYAVALGLHFLVNDQGLREHHGDAYRKYGRWLLGPAPLAGWLLAVAVAVPPLLLSALFAFLAGGWC
jgi:hypothetical protein